MSWLPRNKIVVPIDFSEESFEALDVALEIAPEPAGVHVIHVLPDMMPADPGVIWVDIQDDKRARDAEGALRERLTEDRFRDIQIDIRFGDPGHRIADFAKDLKADLIIMPSHGRTGISHLLIGSVAERVTRLSHCPVLVVRK